MEIFLIGQSRSTNQSSGMVLEVQIQIKHAKVFIFKKFQGAQILIFLDENWQGASFYVKEQTQKYKFESCLQISTILDPQKSAFLVFDENPPPKKCLRVLALIQL